MSLDLRVDGDLMRERFDALAAIGRTPDGGVHRPALGEAHMAARRWFLEEATALGLTSGVDRAGNHWARLHSGKTACSTLALGSHLDSVPNGGRYDGALGVVAALAALTAIRDAGLSLWHHLEVVDFTDEEGNFVGLMGSRALAGILSTRHLENPHGDLSVFDAALARTGLSRSGILSATRDRELAGYFELHIEQGAQLEEQGAQIGVVTGIVGIRSFALTFSGRADHAGTTPLHQRRDAALGACSFTLAARGLVLKEFPGCVANVGDMRFSPGAYNVVPEQVTVALEFRAEDSPTLDEMESALLGQARRDAGRYGLELSVEAKERISSTPTSAKMQALLAAASEDLGLKHIRMPSGAGHDAQSLARLCPVGMIFVPSVGGRSHSPQEFTRWEDCVNGANVLLHAVLKHCD